MSTMTEEQLQKAIQILNDLIDKHESMRAFARSITEDTSDVIKWKSGRKIKTRAVMTIAKVYKIHPHDLRPDLFPEKMKLSFK